MFLHDGYIEGEQRYTLTKTDGAKNQAHLCEVASKVAKEIDPKIRISGPNIYTYSVEGRKFNQTLIDAGAYNSCDFADYHNYGLTEACFPGDWIEQKYTGILGPLIASNFKKPIHMSEGTSAYDGPKYAGMYKHSVPWDQDYAEIIPFADNLCRFVVGTLALGVERINLYTAGSGFLGNEGGGCFTMLNADGYPHPALAAFSNMAWQLEDRKFMKRVKVGENVWAYIFEGRKGTVAVISGYSNGKYTVPNSSALEICDLFGNTSNGEYKGSLLYVKSKLPPDGLESVLAGKE